METRLITNDQQLRRYMPNAFDTVEGETTFHEKIQPWLDQAERWVFTQFIGDDFSPELLAMEETEPLRTCATLVVVHEAFMRAVPSLDLVLTPNGFGIVSNQNIAPASPHRISRLLGSLDIKAPRLAGDEPGYRHRAVDPQPVPQQHVERQPQAAMVQRVAVPEHRPGQPVRFHRTPVGELPGPAFQGNRSGATPR